MSNRIETFRDVLEFAAKQAGGVRPDAEAPPAAKNKYATHFANAMATLLANGLRRTDLQGVKPDAEGRGVESQAQALRGLKNLDVNYSTPEAGLRIGLSLKSVHTRDRRPGQRFHHNMKRNDEELRVEAAGYHQRQPLAVLVAVICLPFEACEDRGSREASSFGTWVKYLWPLGNREDPRGDFDRFERVFVALYDADAAEIGFFDAKTPPPRQGRPARLLSLEAFVSEIVETYEVRNSLDFRWENGEPGNI